MYTTLRSPPPTETWPTTNGWAYTWSSTGSANTAPNCCTLTLLVVNAVSFSFQPDRVLSLCCVRTATDWGFGALLCVRSSLQVASNRSTSGRGSLRLIMSNPQQVYRRIQEECPPSHDRPTERCVAAHRSAEERAHTDSSRRWANRVHHDEIRIAGGKDCPVHFDRLSNQPPSGGSTATGGCVKRQKIEPA